MSLAVWSLGGFYLSLMPSVLRQVTVSQTALSGGAVIAVLMTTGALAILASQHQGARRIILASASVLVLGMLLAISGILSGSLPTSFVGTVAAGAGFGAGFLVALKTALTHVAPVDRAGLMPMLYTISYAAFGGPVLVAGVAIRREGLVPTALGLWDRRHPAVGRRHCGRGGDGTNPSGVTAWSAAHRSPVPPDW